MSNKLLVKGAALITAGALGLVGLGALGPVFSPGTAAAEQQAPSWRGAVAAAPAADSTRPDAGSAGDFGDRITEMMRDHMGVTGEQAEEWAGTMEAMMRSVHGDQADEILDYCSENGGPEGMMDGRNGMMGNWEGTGAGGGMMGGGSGGMMGNWGTN